MWRLCIEDDEANRTVVNLVRKEYTIGRAEENAVRLTERNVSRTHAVLRRTNEGWVLQDLSSQTGCLVNDRPVQKEQAVDHKDRLRIGDYDITLVDSEREEVEQSSEKETETIPSAAEADENLERHDRLVVVEGPNPGTQYPLLEKRLLVGRGEECDLALPDTSVSRVHATLLKDEHGRYHISDQKSSNGVRVNGMEITKIPLYAGDVVELGDVHLQFVPKGSRFDEGALGAKPARSSAPSGGSNKLWLVAGVVGAVGAVMWIGSQRNAEDPDAKTSISAEASLLAKAQAHAEKSELDEAHSLLQRIPASHPERQSPVFRSILAAWADQQFQLAEMSSERNEQVSLLQEVASDPLVDPARRQRATSQLTALRNVVAEDDLQAVEAGTNTDTSNETVSAEAMANAPAVDALPGTASGVRPVAAPGVATRPAAPAVPRASAPVPVKPPAPAPRPQPKPQPRPAVTPSAPVVSPIPKPTAAPAPQPALVPTSSTPQPVPAPAPSPPSATTPTAAPTVKPAPAPAAPSPPAPPPTPPVNSPPVVSWPGATPAPATP